MARRITITRKRGWFAAARALGIYVDGQKVGNLMQTKTLHVELPDDAQAIYGKVDWAKTKSFPVSGLSDGAKLIVRTYFTWNVLKWFGITGVLLRFELADTSEVFR